MNRRLPPNLYERKYMTKGGYVRTLWYPRFKDWRGKRRTFSGIPDFNRAKAELARLMALNDKGHDFDAPKPKHQRLDASIDTFLELKSAKKSIARDRQTAVRLKTFFGNCQIHDIGTSRMLSYRKSRAGLTIATVNRELAFLRSILRLAHQDGALETLPHIPIEAEHNDRVRTASDQEYMAILKKLEPEIRDVVEVLWETGFRLGEVLKLAPIDLYEREKAIHIRRVREKGGLMSMLPMSARAWTILSMRAKGKAATAKLFEPTRYMVRWHFRAACMKLGITELWVHDLRATFATKKERQGWPRKSIREFTGHRTDYAFNRYSRPTIDDLRRFIGNTVATPVVRRQRTVEVTTRN